MRGVWAGAVAALALTLAACAPQPPARVLTPTTTAGPAAAQAVPVLCQREEGGEVIGYTAGQTPRAGFPRVPCPH